MHMNLKRVGYYKEMPHAEESDPSIKDFIGKNYDDSLKNQIIDYLNSGIVIVACAGTSTDVINPDNGEAGCPCMMTDGVWVWPGDLPYYVSRYSLVLPDPFMKFMEEKQWQIEIDEDSIDYDNLFIDGIKLID